MVKEPENIIFRKHTYDKSKFTFDSLKYAKDTLKKAKSSGFIGHALIRKFGDKYFLYWRKK